MDVSEDLGEIRKVLEQVEPFLSDIQRQLVALGVREIRAKRMIKELALDWGRESTSVPIAHGRRMRIKT
jgi:hypothetical protein